ncbi:hypothetical protein BBW65_02335 [Helicobacter enhydrae]|uniref:ABC-2 type transporter transmembrane domain-containing protein n=1 Tax=Helicobacter enhydrae TaxID=222136 RepID=A0A1B1U4L8_9HELI|nr:ABC transporter permease [Helicobacter enhydrae]ANV97713.1 hypothetical protein BBW65_02335 [Helicobacter enhydrae]
MNFFYTLIDEIKRFFTNASVLMVCIVGPLAYFLLYPSPYENNVIKTQKIAIIDKDNTRLSQELAFLADASSEVEIYQYSTSLIQAQRMLERGEIFGIVYIPKGFEKNAYLQSSPSLAFLANSSYFLIYGSIINGLHHSTQALNPLIKEKQKVLYGDFGTKSSQNLSVQKDLITLQSSPLFNPSLGYINYALAAIFIVILHQMLLVGMGIFGATYIHNPLHKILYLVTARSIIFTILAILLFAFYFGFGFAYYGVGRQADIADFWLIALAFIFAIVSFGNFFASLITQPYRATMIILLCSLPLVFLLGFIWPSYAIPAPINFCVQFIPVFQGVNALLRLNEMNASFQEVFSYFKHLLALGCLYTLLSLMIYTLKSRITQSQSK